MTSTLDQLGITAIYLDSTIANATDGSGNTVVRSGHFEWSDGTSGLIADYNLQTNPGDTIPAKELTVPSDIAALPNLIGHGNIYSLQQAMLRDTSGQLKSLVEQFSAATDTASRETLMTQILSTWIGVGSSLSGSGVSNYDSSKLAVLETFFGQRLIDYRYIPWLVEGRIRIPHEAVAGFNNTYREIFEGYYGAFMAQTHLKDLYDKVVSTWDVERQEYHTDMSGVVAELQARIAADPEEGKQLLTEFSRTWRSLNNGVGRDFSLSFREALVGGDTELGWIFDATGMPVYYASGQGAGWWDWTNQHPWIKWSDDAVKGSLTEGDGYIYSLDGNDVVYGTARDEVLSNRNGNAILVGGGDDTVWAGAGNDILDGGEGKDTLYGETGDDTYLFRRGSGQDTVIDVDATSGNVDTIFLGSSLTPDDISLKRSGNNLVLRINDTDDTLTVKDFFRNDGVLNRVEQIRFMDGTLWDEQAIIERVYAPTEGDDVIYGSNEADDLRGAGGNDTIYGRDGADSLHGDADDDRIYGGGGDDTIEGGTGNDTLDGGAGRNTYIFNRGSGQDTIISQKLTSETSDTIALGEGILPADVRLQRMGNDLKLTVLDTQDTLTIKNWVQNDTPASAVQAITFGDGTIWGLEAILEAAVKGTAGNDTIYGFSGSDSMEGFGGDDTIYGLAQASPC